MGEIVTLFKGGMTYGRKDLVQRERKIKLAYVEKLRDVLLAIAADQGNIPDIDESIASNQLGSIYQYYRGSFRVDSPVLKPTTSDIVRLRSRIGRYTLLLDCSLRFFSEGPEPDGTFLLHSGNSSFFNGDIGLKLDSVFILLHREGRQFIGTPLFLRLSTDRPAGMLAL